ncbi:MAG: ThiF family adenylyltransferase [Tannerella sp.]|jgi:molybdopterin/thiamine biosynthesis adenylyltransferase|nr:ThiF family adenylyltransferase [Tannerella sp.]
MKPIVYVYQEQIIQLVKSGEKKKGGVAYEWKGEDVYHAYMEYPAVSPSGFAVACFFEILENKADFDNALHCLEAELNGNEPFIKNVKLVCYFFFDNTVLKKKCFVRDESGIREADINYVPNKSNLYTRTKGLLEVDILEKKRVLIIGLGSGGANIAVELAKSGVGLFTLIDFDRIELHNISRHICGVNELGRLKTKAVRDAILLKNPYAKIDTFELNVDEHPDVLENEIKKADIVVAATDNNRSRLNINTFSIKHRKVVLYGRVIARAEGGDVFIYRPGGPCYCCFMGTNLMQQEEEISSLKRGRESGVIPAYASEADANAMVQVGLSSDIIPVNNMIVKLVLLELSRGLNSGISSLEDELTFYYYIWANRRVKHFSNWDSFNAASKKKPVILKWYGVILNRDPDCMECNSQ